jgi:hypothetical protein
VQRLRAQSLRHYLKLPPTLPVHRWVDTVGYWKRYCRYNDCTGTNVVVVPTPAVPAVPAAPVVVPGSPPVIAVVPVRPVSCGEFRYWNGTACVDARYNTPYIGPR